VAASPSSPIPMQSETPREHVPDDERTAPPERRCFVPVREVLAAFATAAPIDGRRLRKDLEALADARPPSR